jgi:hypothetical protein
MRPSARSLSSAPLVEVAAAELVPYVTWLDPNDVLTLLCGIVLLRLAAQLLRRSETDDGPRWHEPPRDAPVPRTRARPDRDPKRMSEPTRRVRLWGWLRFVLGVLQMVLALAGAVALFTVGLRPVTWGLVAGATAASGLSRWWYRSRPLKDLAD